MKMKNYWLDRRMPKEITNEELESIVIQYKDCPGDIAANNKLADAFYRLAEKVVDYIKFPLLDKDDAKQECVLLGFQKIDRYDPTKGRAFNFFTTIMLGHLRPIYRAARNFQELKERYKKYLIETKKGTLLTVHRDKPEYLEIRSGYGISLEMKDK